MAFRENVLVFSQPGAINAQQLEQLIEQVRELDMEDVHKQVEEARQKAEQDRNYRSRKSVAGMRGPKREQRIPEAQIRRTRRCRRPAPSPRTSNIPATSVRPHVR